MKHSLLQNKIDDVEQAIFNCVKCKELTQLRHNKIHNCPVLGFGITHYNNARICSIAEAPGIYKPHKGEIYIDDLRKFHEIYDDRIQNIARIGKLLMNIYSLANIEWKDIQHFNVVCCSPPEYRRPTLDEIDNCLPHLITRIKLLQNMKVIVTFGKVAKSIIKRLKIDVPVVNSFHPSYIFSYMPEADRDDYINDVANKIKNTL